jgi:hypothetical protein
MEIPGLKISESFHGTTPAEAETEIFQPAN